MPTCTNFSYMVLKVLLFILTLNINNVTVISRQSNRLIVVVVVTGSALPHKRTKGIAKQRKEGSFRERKIDVRKEHFIIIATDI